MPSRIDPTKEFYASRMMDAEAVASRIPQHATIATSGFTSAGQPKVIPPAYARRIEEEKKKGNDFTFNLYTGASTSDELDGVLARSGAMRKRLPFQSNKDLRDGINRGDIQFLDMHLSHVAISIEHGILDPIDVAIIEASEVTPDGRIYLTSSSGMSPTYIKYAKEIYIELNLHHPADLKGYHDIYIPPIPPEGRPIFITHVDDRIGAPFVRTDPDKIKGIVQTNLPDHIADFRAPDQENFLIAEHILDFIQHEIKKGRIPAELLPFQVGVGNVANAAMSVMARNDRFQNIQFYTEVLMDSVFDLLDADKLDSASTTALTFSSAGQERFHREIHELRDKIIIRPQEISNHPEMIRRMGIISMNTALEMDIYGNVNSTHVMGTSMMNGIGGSGDFARNAYISIFMSPSTAKGGAISAIVPMVSHVDHNEHTTQIFVTEQGLADLRGLCPKGKAQAIIEKCAHPAYKDLLREYYNDSLKHSPGKHTPHLLNEAFGFHNRYLETGSMKR